MVAVGSTRLALVIPVYDGARFLADSLQNAHAD